MRTGYSFSDYSKGHLPRVLGGSNIPFGLGDDEAVDRQAAQSRVHTSLDWLFRPFGLDGSSLAWPVASIFCVTLILVFSLDAATPHQVFMVFGLPPLLAGMWLLPRRQVQLVGLTGVVVFIAATITEVHGRGTEISICIVALGLAAVVRWYASEVISLHARQGPPVDLTPQPQNGHASSGLLLLTRRELEIARLASGGYTSREIATLLHISERTVENHIANVYAKLGINSRRALIKMASTIANR